MFVYLDKNKQRIKDNKKKKNKKKTFQVRS